MKAGAGRQHTNPKRNRITVGTWPDIAFRATQLASQHRCTHKKGVIINNISFFFGGGGSVPSIEYQNIRNQSMEVRHTGSGVDDPSTPSITIAWRVKGRGGRWWVGG